MKRCVNIHIHGWNLLKTINNYIMKDFDYAFYYSTKLLKFIKFSD